MDGQDPESNTENQADGRAPEASDSGAAPAAAPSGDVAALQAELAKYQAKAERAEREAIERRLKIREEADAKAEAQRQQGEFKALAETQAQQIEDLKAQLAELEGVSDKAKAYEKLQQSELQAIEQAKEGLPPEAQAALDAAPTLEAKKAFMAALSKTTGPSARVKAEAGSGAAASSAAIDYDSLSRAELTNAILKDPQAYWASKGVNSGKQKGSTLGRMFSKG